MTSLPTVSGSKRRHVGAPGPLRQRSAPSPDQRRRKQAAVRVLDTSLVLATPMLAVSWWAGVQSGQYAINLALTAFYAVSVTVSARRSRLPASFLIRFTWAVWTVVFVASYAEMGFASVAPVLFFFAVSAAALSERQVESASLIVATSLGLLAVFALKMLGVIDPMPAEQPIEDYLGAPVEWLFNMTALVFAGYVVYVAIVRSTFDTRRAADQYRESVTASMVLLARLRDDDTGDHIERCGQLGEMLLRECRRQAVSGADRVDVDDFAHAVKLHDIGKVGVADDILLKPGRLTDDEFAAMRQHTVIGAQIIDQIMEQHDLRSDPLLQLGREIALGHHENWDGSGYPHGHAAGEIPLSARMMSVIDVYDAMRCPRPYKAPLHHAVAIEEIRAQAGRKFDPEIAACFLSIERALPSLYDS